MSDDGCRWSWSAGTRAIGLELVRHYAAQGREVVLTGQSAENVAAAVAEHGDGRCAGSPSTSPSPHTIAAALADVGPVDRLALVAIDRDQNTRRRLRHRPGDPPRHAQARRLHGRGVSTLRRRLIGVVVDRAVRRHGQGAAVPGLDHGHDGQRRRRRA